MDGGDASNDIKSGRHSRAGLMWKLPMSKPTGEKWQRRMCLAKDGFLMYYNATEDISKHFSTKPKGILPLGGAKVEAVERGPKGGKFGIMITHPDFNTGRALVISAESEASRALWLQALQDCSRVTMENALLGDSMVEKLRASGTAAEAEKEEAMLKLQEAALALSRETEEKLALLSNQESVLSQAAAIEERAKAMEAEMVVKLAEVEARRVELEAQSLSIQSEIDSRSAALTGANDEYTKLMALLATAKESSAAQAAGPAAVAAGPAGPAAGAPSGGASTAGAPSAAPATAPSAVPSAAAAPAAAAPASAATGAAAPPAALLRPTAQAPILQMTAAGTASSMPMSPASTAAAVHRAEAQGGLGGMSRAEIQAIEARARHLEEEKIRLEQEKRALERSVRDMAATTATLQSSLHSAEEMKRALQEQMQSLNSEETDLMKERQLRIRLERKLKIAEDSLRRLDGALRRNGIKLDVDVFADVKTLMIFFEERIDESRRDANRIEIMKSALAAKKRYLMASGGEAQAEERGEEGERGDVWDDAPAAPAPAPVAAPAHALPLPAAPGAALAALRRAAPPTPVAPEGRDDDHDDAWNSDDERGDARSSCAASMNATHADVRVDTEGRPLPPGWTLQRDEDGDTWYFHAETSATSWVRPNDDGTIPPSA